MYVMWGSVFLFAFYISIFWSAILIVKRTGGNLWAPLSSLCCMLVCRLPVFFLSLMMMCSARSLLLLIVCGVLDASWHCLAFCLRGFTVGCPKAGVGHTDLGCGGRAAKETGCGGS